MKEMNWLKSSLIAHRGLHDNITPENSLEACLNAAKKGYDIEFDLQLTKDKQLVVIHDRDLNRLCGINKKVSQLTYKELSELPLLNSSHKTPLFKDLLETLPKTTNLMIELKTAFRYRKLVDIFLKMIKEFDFNYIVQSFDFRIVRLLKKKAPHITRGYITEFHQTECNFINTLFYNIPIELLAKPDYYVCNFEELPNERMDKIKQKGIPVLSYTVHTQEDLDFIQDRYDNAVFEGFIPNNKKS